MSDDYLFSKLDTDLCVNGLKHAETTGMVWYTLSAISDIQILKGFKLAINVQ